MSTPNGRRYAEEGDVCFPLTICHFAGPLATNQSMAVPCAYLLKLHHLCNLQEVVV